MLGRGRRASAADIAVLAALVAWALFPLVLLLAHAASRHARFTGADGLIGVDGVLGADQLQYLAWIRDGAAHGGLTADLFWLGPPGHVYLEPVFALSAALYRLGVSLPVAYLVWKLVAAVALAAAAGVWAGRFFAGRLGARLAAATLALFLYTPLAALYSWTGLASGSFRFNLYLLGGELLAADKLWGYVPSAIGLALVPAVLLAVEHAAAPIRPGARRQRHRSAAAPTLLAGAGALLAAWLHPWQGITLILILAGLAVWRRLAGWPALLVPALAAALPLAYYYLLSHHDPAWQLAARYEVIPRLPALVLLAGLGPLVPIAALGVRRPGGALLEQAQLLWIAACFVTYFVNDSFSSHALQGLSFPLAVLLVRGWGRLRAPALLGAAAVVLLTIPGLAYDARKFVLVARGQAVQYYLTADDARALDWVARHAPPGGVLAPTPFAAVIPSQTGRAVWAGNGYWTPDYEARGHAARRLFGGHLRPAAAQRFVAGTGARILVSDCRHPADLTRALGSTLLAAPRFGCARVYVLRSA